MLRKDSHGKIIQHCRIILVKGEYYGLIIRCLDICDILIIAGNACTQSFILCKLFVSIYNIFSIKIFSVMPLHTITKFKSISIGIFIKGIALCKILYRFSICIILHQPGKNKIRKLIMIVQKRIDRTFRLSCIDQCFVFFCCKCSYCTSCYSSCTYCCHCRKRYCCTFLSVTVLCSLFHFCFPHLSLFSNRLSTLRLDLSISCQIPAPFHISFSIRDCCIYYSLRFLQSFPHW